MPPYIIATSRVLMNLRLFQLHMSTSLRVMIIDLLVERAEFGHGGNQEVIKPIAALSDVEVLASRAVTTTPVAYTTVEKEEMENNCEFSRCMGSRKLKGKTYIKDKNNGRDPGAPFPNNLRKSRQNRPHRNKKIML